jgi:monovalent cation:H+ antiporter, CPA1 family
MNFMVFCHLRVAKYHEVHKASMPPLHPPGLFVSNAELIIGLLLVAAVVSLAAQRLHIPYTVGLVLVGLALTILGPGAFPTITSELILVLLVPPLVFEAAFFLDLDDLWRELPLVLLLTIPGVILTTLLVGGLVSLAAGLPLVTALVFGAMISATDPVAVVALFRTFGVPKRLQVILEGESLLNDGTAIVIFNLMLVVALTGHFDPGASLAQFFVVAGGGILVGAAAGVIVAQIISKIDNYLVETTLTTVLAYGSYLFAEYVLGVSGVLAVVAAGLMAGKIGPRGMSSTTRVVVFNFWEYAAFLANSFIFLIIGLQINVGLLVNNAQAILWGILAVIAARAVTIYGLTWFYKSIPHRWKHILFWGGLRGAISLALALSLDAALPYHDQLQAMAFGVVLFTLLVDGLTMQPLIKRTGVVQTSSAHFEFELRHARAVAMRASQTRLEELSSSGLISDYTWRTLRPVLSRRAEQLTRELQEVLEAEPVLHQEELAQAWREMLQVQRATLTTLYHDHIISDEAYTELVAEVDILITSTQGIWPELDNKED